jgi:hypothetical protein
MRGGKNALPAGALVIIAGQVTPSLGGCQMIEERDE